MNKDEVIAYVLASRAALAKADERIAKYAASEKEAAERINDTVQALVANGHIDDGNVEAVKKALAVPAKALRLFERLAELRSNVAPDAIGSPVAVEKAASANPYSSARSVSPEMARSDAEFVSRVMALKGR